MVDKKSEPPPKKKEARKKLEPGKYVDSEQNKYKIESVLGSGGFGDVYKVCPAKNSSLHYAMKTEFFDPQKRKLLNRLKVEMGVFADIQKCSAPIDKSCFVEMIDKGKTSKFKFIVMEMISHSLIDISKNMMKTTPTSPSTNIQIARQTLRAIEAFHIVGYIHRDIKPHNFAIGRPPKDNKIYMLDFGIARKYTGPDNRLRIPRSKVKFLGTVKFASIACHKEQEQSRKDDIEVWVYMMFEYFDKDNIIWRKTADRNKIGDLKIKAMAKPQDLKLPKKFIRAVEMTNKMTYTCIPDYAAFHKILDDIVKDENIDESAPLDWIGMTMDTGTKQKKTAAEKLQDDENSGERRKRDEKEKKRKEVADERKRLENELAKLYKQEEQFKTPEQIKAEARSRMRKKREAEKRQRRERERQMEEEEEDEDDDDSEEEYSEEDTRQAPRQRSKMLSVHKSLQRDEPSRQSKYSRVNDEPSMKKHESRKKKTRKNKSHEDIDNELDRRPRDRPSRRKDSRRESSYGKVNSRMDRAPSQKKVRKIASKMLQPTESPHKNESQVRTFNDYIVFRAADDMEKEADAKDKKAEADKRSSLMGIPNDKERPPSAASSLPPEFTGKDPEGRKDGSEHKK